MNNKIYASLFLGIGLLLLLIISMNRNIGVYDEGIILTGALRVYQGDYPHRDFYANYGPANFFTLALLFKIFGKSIFIERIFDLTEKILILFSAYLLLLNYCRTRYTFLGVLICFFILLGMGNYGYPVTPALLFSLIALIFLVHQNSGQGVKQKLFAAGFFVGIATLFRYDMGFLSFCALFLTLFFSIGSNKSNFWPKDSTCFKKIGLYTLGVIFPLACIFLLHFKQNALLDFVHDVITFPASHYNLTRGLPFPRQLNVIYLPPVIVTIAVFKLWARKYKNNTTSEVLKSNESGKAICLIGLMLLSSFFYIKGLVRVSPTHMIPSIIPSVLLAFILLEDLKNEIARKITIGVLVLFFTHGIYSARNNLSLIIIGKNLISIKAIIFTSSGSSNIDDFFVIEDYRAAAMKYLKSKISPGDFFYSGLVSHDKIYINDNFSYFYLDSKPATKWHHFDPALQNSYPIQAEMIREIKEKKPEFIMLDNSWANVSEPNESSKHSGVFILDDFIIKNYRSEKEFGPILILRIIH